MRLLVFVSLLLSWSALAAEKGSHTCRILFLNAPTDAPEKLFLFDGKVSQEVQLPRMNFSPVYRLAAGDLTLVMSEKSYMAPEEVDPKAPRVKVPAAVKDFYLLVASDPKNTVAPVSLKVVPIDSSTFKRGEMMWFNLTGNSVGGKVGRQDLAMKANSRTLLKAPAVGNEDYHVNLAYRIPGKKHLYPLCETKWVHDPNSRMVVFVMTQNGSRTPRVMGFADFRNDGKEGKPAE
ncbi:hypothetical protein [Haloferula rosea]|uniref:DUF4397 domain-containing protein n=1 Tax=Haloferula rosea TaxID=490093 RepID=A0A934R9V2_9BACT|nr:hypothetical protein [Haloferula rosea]MBK1825459.1 hypothetical protein [Haloferula rosea]